MRKRRIAGGSLAAAAVFAFASSGMTDVAVAMDDHSVACDTLRINSPHFSSGAGGIIAKANLIGCGPTARVNEILSLWRCPSNAAPPKNAAKSWLQNHGCVMKAQELYAPDGTYFNPDNPDTKYVPNTGKPGAHGTGIWVALMHWADRYVNVNGDYVYEQGTVSEVSQGVLTG